jgi:hypothetical protein
MTRKDLLFFKDWYSKYSNSFHTSDEKVWKHLLLKIDHTKHVQKYITGIALDLDMSDREIMLAETIALFHDLGRFRQFTEYKTFQDRKSKNHGLLATKTLIENNVLKNLPDDEQWLIFQTVKFHNAFAIPSILDDYSKLFLKMVRDADKLDIFRVFIEYYESPPEQKAAETAFGLPDTEEYSDEVISYLNSGRTASYRSLKTENDFKLLKLSWIYGLHFNYSLRLVIKNDYINILAGKLPETEEIKLMVGKVKEYISEKLTWTGSDSESGRPGDG